MIYSLNSASANWFGPGCWPAARSLWDLLRCREIHATGFMAQRNFPVRPSLRNQRFHSRRHTGSGAGTWAFRAVRIRHGQIRYRTPRLRCDIAVSLRAHPSRTAHTPLPCVALTGAVRKSATNRALTGQARSTRAALASGLAFLYTTRCRLFRPATRRRLGASSILRRFFSPSVRNSSNGGPRPSCKQIDIAWRRLIFHEPFQFSDRLFTPRGALRRLLCVRLPGALSRRTRCRIFLSRRHDEPDSTSNGLRGATWSICRSDKVVSADISI